MSYEMRYEFGTWTLSVSTLATEPKKISRGNNDQHKDENLLDDQAFIGKIVIDHE